MKKRSIIRSALCLVLAAVLCLSMAACGRTQTPADEGTTSESSAPLSSALPVKALQPKQVEKPLHGKERREYSPRRVQHRLHG